MQFVRARVELGLQRVARIIELIFADTFERLVQLSLPQILVRGRAALRQQCEEELTNSIEVFGSNLA